MASFSPTLKISTVKSIKYKHEIIVQIDLVTVPGPIGKNFKLIQHG